MFYRFIALPDEKGHAYLAFGPARVRIDYVGHWMDHDIAHGADPRRVAEIEAVLGTVREVLPDLIAHYTAETGLIRFGKPTSSRRMALLEHIADRLNASIDAPARGGVFE